MCRILKKKREEGTLNIFFFKLVLQTHYQFHFQYHSVQFTMQLAYVFVKNVNVNKLVRQFILCMHIALWVISCGINTSEFSVPFQWD